ncbi:hypothetical protein CSV72_13530 [Sporosarcina sp. P20a]|nr:hypothetical protein CSV72_13530 [Sporosarcina sp. P20a]
MLDRAVKRVDRADTQVDRALKHVDRADIDLYRALKEMFERGGFTLLDFVQNTCRMSGSQA